MKCIDCNTDKPEVDFYTNGRLVNGQPRYRKRCKPCFCKSRAGNVISWRQDKKTKLVNLHGGKCLDCAVAYPPFVMHFDHRDPKEKSFGISEGGETRSYERMLQESLKCDLVCANCHAFRTHKQRCKKPNCQHCLSVGPAFGELG